ncbi:MAG: hypothetical protein IJ214_13050 [Clostridia bacterium]|nr:hypothetical protein [Clostridia bacterium]
MIFIKQPPFILVLKVVPFRMGLAMVSFFSTSAAILFAYCPFVFFWGQAAPENPSLKQRNDHKENVREGNKEEEMRTGAFSFGARKRTRKGCVGRRKSGNRKEKRQRKDPLPGSTAKPCMLCALRTGESRAICRKTSELVLSPIALLSGCPEALFATFKLQAQIVSCFF